MQTQTLMPGRCGGQKAASPGLKVEDCHAHSMRPSQQGSSRNPHVVNAQKGCMLCVCDEDEEKVLRTSDHKKNYKIAAALRTHIKKANLQPLKRSLDLEQTDENAKKKRNTTTAIHVAKEKKKKTICRRRKKQKKHLPNCHQTSVIRNSKILQRRNLHKKNGNMECKHHQTTAQTFDNSKLQLHLIMTSKFTTQNCLKIKSARVKRDKNISELEYVSASSTFSACLQASSCLPSLFYLYFCLPS